MRTGPWSIALWAAAGCAIAGLASVGGRAADTAAASLALSRPQVATWPTVGTTVRVAAPDKLEPAQFRQVQIDPAGYAALLKHGKFAQGTMFAVKFFAVALDRSQNPPLYHATTQTAFAVEVIDHRHPDGRRFYIFAGGAATASPLPAGNACAQCHRASGSFDGTFAHLYPLIADRVPAAGETPPKD